MISHEKMRESTVKLVTPSLLWEIISSFKELSHPVSNNQATNKVVNNQIFFMFI
jgi:hypothetical protein